VTGPVRFVFGDCTGLCGHDGVRRIESLWTATATAEAYHLWSDGSCRPEALDPRNTFYRIGEDALDALPRLELKIE
jgi:hypothetical protein